MTIETNFSSRTALNGGSFGTLMSGTYVLLGGDMWYSVCYCSLYNARVSVDYAPSTLDEMYNLAFLGLASKLKHSDA